MTADFFLFFKSMRAYFLMLKLDCSAVKTAPKQTLSSSFVLPNKFYLYDRIINATGSIRERFNRARILNSVHLLLISALCLDSILRSHYFPLIFEKIISILLQYLSVSGVLDTFENVTLAVTGS